MGNASGATRFDIAAGAFEEAVARHGSPERVMSDEGAAFRSWKFRSRAAPDGGAPRVDLAQHTASEAPSMEAIGPIAPRSVAGEEGAP